MKIENGNFQLITSTKKNSIKKEKLISSHVELKKMNTEKNDIAKDAKELSSLLQLLKEIPSVDQSKIDRIGLMMESNNYNVTGQDVINKILGEK